MGKVSHFLGHGDQSICCLPGPIETRILKTVTNMSKLGVQYKLLLKLQSVKEVLIWRADDSNIWDKGNETEQSWPEEISFSQELFISDSRNTNGLDGKLSKISQAGNLRMTLTHHANAGGVTSQKLGKAVKTWGQEPNRSPKKPTGKPHCWPWQLWIWRLQAAQMEGRVRMCGHKRYRVFLSCWHQVLLLKAAKNRHISESHCHSLPVLKLASEDSKNTYLLLLPGLPNVQLHHKHHNTVTKPTSFLHSICDMFMTPFHLTHVPPKPFQQLLPWPGFVQNCVCCFP